MDIDDYRINIEAKAITLTHKDELNLAFRILKGEEDAIYLLTDPNLLLAFKYAESYHNQPQYQNISFEDLIHLANEGLYRAAKAYSNSEGKNFRFKDYAAWWIKQSISSVRSTKI